MSEEVAKGVNFVFAREYVAKEHGDFVWQKALARLEEDHAKVWTGALVPFSTYSFPAFKAMARAARIDDEEDLKKLNAGRN